MTERGWGRVVNTASIAGVTGYVYPSYAASKAGVVNLTRSLLVDFWGTGVTVNALCPGAMDTEMLDRSAIPAFIRKTPAGRVVTPQEVAAVFDFLAGEEAACVNGATIVVDVGPLTEVTAAAIADLFAVNVIGTTLVTQACLPALTAARGAVVTAHPLLGL